MIHPGKEEENQTYYVIRSRGKSEGLLSTWFYVCENVRWALENNYIPCVDFESENCQYYVGKTINDTNNAWEYFFKQPVKLSREELKKKRNVLLSGWSLRKDNIERITFEDLKKEKIYNIRNMLDVQSYIEEKVLSMWKKMFWINGMRKHTLGVFVRGTDYITLKPKGHYVQPELGDVIVKIEEFLEKYDIDQIYVVTEDYSYYTELKKIFGDKIFSSDSNFVKNYSTKDYVSEAFDNDPYERGLMYLIRILLLSKCEYVISSKANGSMFAELMREDECIDSYWFDLGIYD